MNTMPELAKIIQELEDFFETNVPDYKIEIANSREEFNKLTDRQSTESWMAGWANGHKIVVIHPDKLKETTNGIHKSDSHTKRIKHELAHLFYAKLTKDETKPAWLNEGLAFYLDGRGGMAPKDYENKYAAIKYFVNYDGQVYKPGSFMVKALLDKFGKAKILKLIKSIKPDLTEEKFKNLFLSIYGFEFSEESLKKIL